MAACRSPKFRASEAQAGMTIFKPTNADEVLAAVRWAAANKSTLEVVGHGSKRGIGRPGSCDHVLDLAKLTGVTLYEPEELVLSARAGTPLAEIDTLVARNGQQLAFEPPDYSRMLNATRKGYGTVGGMLGANLAGPRRLKVGSARDHVLGVRAVSGRGEAFKSGGRVVKNVTGYDLSKLMAGAWGTLAVATEVTFKVLPAPETETTLVLSGLLDEAAVSAMALCLAQPAEVSGAAHLPEGISARVGNGALGGESATLIRLEGFGPSVADRARSLARMLDAGSALSRIEGDASRRLWREVRDCIPFADGSETPVWRISMAPTHGHRMVMALRMETAAEAFYDWQGGLVWLKLPQDCEHGLVRRLVRAHGGGHATLLRAPAEERAAVPVFEPQPPALAALTARVKEQFDPHNVLNPERMAAA